MCNDEFVLGCDGEGADQCGPAELLTIIAELSKLFLLQPSKTQIRCCTQQSGSLLLTKNMNLQLIYMYSSRYILSNCNIHCFYEQIIGVKSSDMDQRPLLSASGEQQQVG